MEYFFGLFQDLEMEREGDHYGLPAPFSQTPDLQVLYIIYRDYMGGRTC